MGKPDNSTIPCVEAEISAQDQWTDWISCHPGGRLLGLAEFSGGGTVTLQWRGYKLDNTTAIGPIDIDSQTADFAKQYDMIAGEYRIGVKTGDYSAAVYVSLRTEIRGPG